MQRKSVKKELIAIGIILAVIVIIGACAHVKEVLTPETLEEKLVHELEEIGYEDVGFYTVHIIENNETAAEVRMKVSTDPVLGISQPYAGFHSMYYHLIQEGDYTIDSFDLFIVIIENPFNDKQANWATRPCHFYRKIILEKATRPAELMDNESLVTLKITALGDDKIFQPITCL